MTGLDNRFYCSFMMGNKMLPLLLHAVFSLSEGIITPSSAAQVPCPQYSKQIQDIHGIIHVLEHNEIQTSICPAGSSSPESKSPTELISLSRSSSSPASSALSFVAYLETYSASSVSANF